jgi:hypothetical protein
MDFAHLNNLLYFYRSVNNHFFSYMSLDQNNIINFLVIYGMDFYIKKYHIFFNSVYFNNFIHILMHQFHISLFFIFNL